MRRVYMFSVRNTNEPVYLSNLNYARTVYLRLGVCPDAYGAVFCDSDNIL